MQKKTLISLMLLTGLLLAIALYLLRADYLELRTNGTLMNPPYLHFGRGSSMSPLARPVPAAQAGMIRDWMTFEYINRVFGLPATYLENGLSLTEPKYPKLTIRQAAKDLQQPEATFLARVQSMVQQFKAPTAP